jgi:hypothetical protein
MYRYAATSALGVRRLAGATYQPPCTGRSPTGRRILHQALAPHPNIHGRQIFSIFPKNPVRFFLLFSIIKNRQALFTTTASPQPPFLRPRGQAVGVGTLVHTNSPAILSGPW